MRIWAGLPLSKHLATLHPRILELSQEPFSFLPGNETQPQAAQHPGWAGTPFWRVETSEDIDSRKSKCKFRVLDKSRVSFSVYISQLFKEMTKGIDCEWWESPARKVSLTTLPAILVTRTLSPSIFTMLPLPTHSPDHTIHILVPKSKQPCCYEFSWVKMRQDPPHTQKGGRRCEL